MCDTTFSNENTHEKLAAKWCLGKLWGFIGFDHLGCYNVYDGFLVVACNVKQYDTAVSNVFLEVMQGNHVGKHWFLQLPRCKTMRLCNIR